MIRLKGESIDKPGSVWKQKFRGNHSSRMYVTIHLKQPTRIPREQRVISKRFSGFLFGLAPSGVYLAIAVTNNAVRSYRTISPLPTFAGGIFSVALSVGLHLPGITWRFALWSPDFPLRLNTATA